MMPYKHTIPTSLFRLPLPDDEFIPSLCSPNVQHLLPNLPLNNLASYVTKKIEAIRKRPPPHSLHPRPPPPPPPLPPAPASAHSAYSAITMVNRPSQTKTLSCEGVPHTSPTLGSHSSPSLLSPAPSRFLSTEPFPSM